MTEKHWSFCLYLEKHLIESVCITFWIFRVKTFLHTFEKSFFVSGAPDLISEMGGVFDDFSLCYWLSFHVNKHIDWLIKTGTEKATSKWFSYPTGASMF